LLAKALTLVALLGLLFGSPRVFSAEAVVMEYQVKLAFLMNFAKYVDWPASSFPASDTPISIGLYGEDKFGNLLKQATDGKAIAGRRIVTQRTGAADNLGDYHILFISDSEAQNLGELLSRIKGLPVLTVGETEQFLTEGGVINFVKKEGKVRLEINLAAARNGKLDISSKLLSVADAVVGKAK
jgi:hypothetical protein